MYLRPTPNHRPLLRCLPGAAPAWAACVACSAWDASAVVRLAARSHTAVVTSAARSHTASAVVGLAAVVELAPAVANVSFS